MKKLFSALIFTILGAVPASAGPASAFIIQAPAVNTGEPFNFTVRAVDVSGNSATTYTGTKVSWFRAELPAFPTRGEPATFVVTAQNRDYQTVTGYRGTEQCPDITLTATPHLGTTKHYWVRITSPCGVVHSTTATVSITSRRRAAGRR